MDRVSEAKYPVINKEIINQRGESMVENKQMPFEEKFKMVLNYHDGLDDEVLPLIKAKLGDQKVIEIKRIWREELKPTPYNATSEENYNIAFNNWLTNWGTAYRFILENMGEEGLNKFKELAVAFIKSTIPLPAVQMMKIMRKIIPGASFKMIAKNIAYQTQVFTPFSVSELTNKKLVIDIPQCKVLDHPNGENFCKLGCQEISTIPLRDLFQINFVMNRHGKSCSGVCTPLS